jgi:ATP-dependent DNA ligase
MSNYMAIGGQATADELAMYEQTDEYYAEPKRDGSWAEYTCDGSKAWTKSATEWPFPIQLPALGRQVKLIGEYSHGSSGQMKAEAERIGHPYIEVFDILQLDNEDLSRCSFQERRMRLEEFMRSIPAHMELRQLFRIVPQWSCDFHSKFLEEEEGIVLKAGDSGAWQPDGVAMDWIKVKKVLTVDMVLMNYQLTGIMNITCSANFKSIVCGAYVGGRLVPLTKCSNIPHEMVEAFMSNWSQYVGMVVELRAFKVFKSGALRNPELVRIREDKAPERCTVESILKLSR